MINIKIKQLSQPSNDVVIIKWCWETSGYWYL